MNKEGNPFGNYLKQQLKARNKPMSWLANLIRRQGVKLDDSALRRWMRSERLPPQDHPALEAIATILELPLEELRQHQQASIRPRRANLEIDPSQRADQIAESQADESELEGVERELSGLEQKFADSQATFEGKTETIAAAIAFLEHLAKQEVPSDNKIFLTFLGRVSIFHDEILLRVKWYRTVKILIKKGWNICHYLTIDDDWERIIDFVSEILQLVGYEIRDGETYKGKYEIRISNENCVLLAAQGFVVVPSQNKGMLFFATSEPEFVDSAIYINSLAPINIIGKYLIQFNSRTQEMFEPFDHHRQLELLEILKQEDQRPGNRVFLIQEMPEITRPLSWFEAKQPYSNFAMKLGSYLNLLAEPARDASELTVEEKEKLNLHLEARKSRLEVLMNYFRKGEYNFQFIVANGCIQEYAESGKNGSSNNYFTPNDKEKLQQMKELKKLLDFQNLEFALLKEKIGLYGEEIKTVKPRGRNFIRPHFCEVQGDHLILMEVWITDNEGNKKSEWLIGRNPTVVRAFRQYLLNFWKDIPKERKDKFRIVQWLDQQIQTLNDKIDRKR